MQVSLQFRNDLFRIRLICFGAEIRNKTFVETISIVNKNIWVFFECVYENNSILNAFGDRHLPMPYRTAFPHDD